jgi:glyoxylate/hydroxypyruvate reductase A
MNFPLISEMTVTILGVGSIGSFLCKEFKRLGCRVLAFGRSARLEGFLKENGIDGYYNLVEEALPETDCIISVLPHTEETICLLDNKFNNCKMAPMFINVGRGTVVSESYLIDCLDKGYLSLAILDVFKEEPLPPNNPLWTHPKVYITPHISAKTRNRDLAELFVKNFAKFEKGEKLLNEIIWGQEY